MLSLLFIHFNKQNLRTRLLAGILVLAILFLILGTVFFRLFLYDPLAAYASSNTTFYLHLNLDKKGSYYQTKVIDSILANFQLETFDRHQLKDELAIVCNQQPFNNCYLVFFASNKKITEKYLKDQKASYQASGFNTFFVSQKPIKNPNLKKSWNPLTYWRYHSGLLKDDLTLVFNQALKPQTLNQKLLAFLQPSLRLSGTIKNRGIVLKSLSFTAAKADWQSDYTDINRPEFDILVNLANPTRPNPLLAKYLGAISQTNGDQALKLLTDNGFTLIMKKIGSSGELLTDYQIFISSSAKLESKDIAKLKSIIGEIGGRLAPNKKNIYLNDGTKVTLLSKNPSPIAQQTDQSYQLLLDNDQKIFLNSSNSGLAIGNNLNFQPKLANNNNNYSLIRLSGLPDYNPIKKYLNEFSFLYADNSKVIIK